MNLFIRCKVALLKFRVGASYKRPVGAITVEWPPKNGAGVSGRGEL